MIDIFYWQLSKYKNDIPLYGGEQQIWTAVSDIGKVFNGEVLSVEEYKMVEDLYIKSIFLFIRYTKTDGLAVMQLEKPLSWDVIKESNGKKGLNDYHSANFREVYDSISVGQVIDSNEVEFICRLALRENLWIQLQSESMFLSFDYDYYVDIGVAEAYDAAIDQIRKWGLNINKWEESYPFDSFGDKLQ